MLFGEKSYSVLFSEKLLLSEKSSFSEKRSSSDKKSSGKTRLLKCEKVVQIKGKGRPPQRGARRK